MEQVGERGICGRLSDDRFMCLCERRERYDDKMFFDFVAKINRLKENRNNIMVKWGIYEISDRSVSVEQMCDRAMLAANSIKGQYHKYFSFYDDELRSKLLREQAITDVIETALQQKQFVVYLQPKYSLNGDCLAGAEALVRWNHPELGFISPGEFIPLFEKNGFITRLDRYVWDRVCALLRKWMDKRYPIFPVSVNVSRADIYQADLVSVLWGLVQKYKISTADLHLEITESAYTENPGQIIETVDRLRQLGFVIEMDDFGTGYSSLNMLNQMKLDILKLDMKFIQSETAKPVDQGILRFIVGLARWMNLSVVAEGVETREQLERLREIGCDYVQGYFFAKPMSIDQFERMLEQEARENKTSTYHRESGQQKRKYLLVVDEDPAYRSMVRETFAEQFQILEASNVQHTLELVKEKANSMSAVILSMTLPDQGAFVILKQLGENYSAWRIPVLATAPMDSGLEEQALKMDADDFAGKPHTSYSLQKRIMRLLGMTVYQERERRLLDEASRDYLTGLLNRRGFHTAIKNLRQDDLPIAIYLFDLDNLKIVNDSLGHEEGDEILKTFSSLLRSQIRDADILARYGGDEFIVILKRIHSEETALKKGKAICQAFQKLCLSETLPAACSAGVVLCRTDEEVTEKLINQADQALYHAKLENKGGCCLWEAKEI